MRITGAGETNLGAADKKLAIVRPDQSAENLDQRRLARAVLAEQGVDLATLHVEACASKRDRGAESLGDFPRGDRVNAGHCWHSV